MKTGLTPAESMVVNGGERSNAALAGTIETELSQSGERSNAAPSEARGG